MDFTDQISLTVQLKFGGNKNHYDRREGSENARCVKVVRKRLYDPEIESFKGNSISITMLCTDLDKRASVKGLEYLGL